MELLAGDTVYPRSRGAKFKPWWGFLNINESKFIIIALLDNSKVIKFPMSHTAHRIFIYLSINEINSWTGYNILFGQLASQLHS